MLKHHLNVELDIVVPNRPALEYVFERFYDLGISEVSDCFDHTIGNEVRFGVTWAVEIQCNRLVLLPVQPSGFKVDNQILRCSRRLYCFFDGSVLHQDVMRRHDKLRFNLSKETMRLARLSMLWKIINQRTLIGRWCDSH